MFLVIKSVSSLFLISFRELLQCVNGQCACYTTAAASLENKVTAKSIGMASIGCIVASSLKLRVSLLLNQP